jgi:hypothetical protein
MLIDGGGPHCRSRSRSLGFALRRSYLTRTIQAKSTMTDKDTVTLDGRTYRITRRLPPFDVDLDDLLVEARIKRNCGLRPMA